MDVLVVGGTRFVGRWIVEALLQRDLEVTLFNRGSHADVFPDVTSIHGDRDVPGDLERLGERRWDAVIDTCAYRPEQVRSLLATVTARPHYTLVSTISVYDDPDPTGADEGSELKEALFAGEVTGETYGPLKVGCEQVAAAAGLPLFVVRPGLVAGPHDPTDRFTYWVKRIAAGGEVLAPEGPDLDVQWIDVRDLGEWIAATSVAGHTGTFNAVNPAGRDTLGGLLQAAGTASDSAPELVWADETFLLEHEVTPFRDLPLWVPEEDRGLMRVSSERARQAGLACRPTMQTVRDTLAWLRTGRGEGAWQAGIDRRREAELISAWRNRR